MAPTEKCNCPALGTCYHILGARRSVGLEDKTETVVLNMSELIKKGRKRPNKLPGRKAPRPVDRKDMNESTINPAPDSVRGKLYDHEDDEENFASTPATKGSWETPKSILKRKCEDEGIPSTNRKAKRLRLTLPKTKNRKSLLNAFSDLIPENDNNPAVDSCNNVEKCNSETGFQNVVVNQSCNIEEKCDIVTTTTLSEKNDSLKMQDNLPSEASSAKCSNIEETNDSNKGAAKTSPILIHEEVPLQLDTEAQIAKAKRIWRELPNKKFSVGFCDKNEIRYDKKMNSDVINFSLGLLQTQFQDINGFQHCGYAPIKENDTSKYGLKMKQVSAPCAQIHHGRRPLACFISRRIFK